MKQFLKKEQVQLVNGGYLSNNEEKPVFNQAFVDAQKRAEYIVTFAEMAKDKDFVGKKADSLEDLQKAVAKALEAKKTKFVEGPEAPEKSLTKKLADEALAFMTYEKDVNKADKINNFLSEFEVINEFESFGLFFEEDIVKLNKIYTMQEIVDAVKATIDLLK